MLQAVLAFCHLHSSELHLNDYVNIKQVHILTLI